MKFAAMLALNLVQLRNDVRLMTKENCELYQSGKLKFDCNSMSHKPGVEELNVHPTGSSLS